MLGLIMYTVIRIVTQKDSSLQQENLAPIVWNGTNITDYANNGKIVCPHDSILNDFGISSLIGTLNHYNYKNLNNVNIATHNDSTDDEKSEYQDDEDDT